MPLTISDFAHDTFLPCRLLFCRAGDIVRLDGAVCQVLTTLGFVLVAKDLATGERRSLSVATMGKLEKRAGEPLPVEW